MTWQIEFKSEAVDGLERIERPIAQRTLTKARWLSESFEQNNSTAVDGFDEGLIQATRWRLPNHLLS